MKSAGVKMLDEIDGITRRSIDCFASSGRMTGHSSLSARTRV